MPWHIGFQKTAVVPLSLILGGFASHISTGTALDTWTTRSNGFSNEAASAVFVNSSKTIWLCGASSGSLMYSADGKTFVSKTSGFGAQQIWGFASNGTTIVMCGGVSAVLLASSTDGQTWTSRNALFPAFTYGANSVRFINNLFVVALGGSAGGAVMSSLDGQTWTSKFAGFANRCNNVIWDGSKYVATTITSNSAVQVWTSTNLTTWTSKSSIIGSDCNGYGIEFSGGVYVLAVTVGNGAFKSTDLLTWTSTGSAIPTGTTQRLALVGTTFVICASLGSLASSTNGVTWVSRNSGLYADAIQITAVTGV